jgi:hypothetical protein
VVGDTQVQLLVAIGEKWPNFVPNIIGLVPLRRNRFGGPPYDLARQSFAVVSFAVVNFSVVNFSVVNFSVVGPEDLDRVSTRVGARRCSPLNLLRNVGAKPSFALQVNHIRSRKKTTYRNVMSILNVS